MSLYFPPFEKPPNEIGIETIRIIREEYLAPFLDRNPRNARLHDKFLRASELGDKESAQKYASQCVSKIMGWKFGYKSKEAQALGTIWAEEKHQEILGELVEMNKPFPIHAVETLIDHMVPFTDNQELTQLAALIIPRWPTGAMFLDGESLVATPDFVSFLSYGIDLVYGVPPWSRGKKYDFAVKLANQYVTEYDLETTEEAIRRQLLRFIPVRKNRQVRAI